VYIAELLIGALLRRHATQDKPGGIGAVDQGVIAIDPVGDVGILDRDGVAFTDLGRLILIKSSCKIVIAPKIRLFTNVDYSCPLSVAEVVTVYQVYCTMLVLGRWRRIFSGSSI
jgi:hypothetical protein